MKSLILNSILILALGISACSSRRSDKDIEKESLLKDLPSWVLDPAISGKIAAVGMAPNSAGGLQFQIPQAEADARGNIASQINTEVSRMTKNALREARIAGIDDVENVFSQVTKNVVKKVPVRGSRRINMYKDPEDKTLYVHMAIDNEMILKHFEDNKKLYDKALKEASVPRARLRDAEKAVENLYKELEEELK